jgi:taspase (threonine aspartase 1)
MGVPELPHDALVSPAAKERWVKWHQDLKLAERKARKNGQHPYCWKIREATTAEDLAEQERLRREHTKNMLRYSQQSGADSPITFKQSIYYAIDDDSSTSPSNRSGLNSDYSMASYTTGARTARPELVSSDPAPDLLLARPASIEESSRSAFINSTQKIPTLNQLRKPRASGHPPIDLIAEDGMMADVGRAGFHARRSWGDGSGEESESSSATMMMSPEAEKTAALSNVYKDPDATHTSRRGILEAETAPHTTLTPIASMPLHSRLDQKEDHITDTVGAVAVDGWGNIACAASSGGIGMKYRGRVGPAALVGVGTAVIPKNPDDPDGTCVATVTSGTGEHMATTMAATVCAERLYQSVRKQKSGEYAEVTEDEALRSMIENEFMGKRIWMRSSSNR